MNRGVIHTTPRKEKALQALLTCRTKGEAAKAAGIGETTMRGYLHDPEFQERYREAFNNLLQNATRKAQQSIEPAIDTLREIMEDKSAGAQARILAARSSLEYAIRLTDQLDILGRIEALENAQKEGER